MNEAPEAVNPIEDLAVQSAVQSAVGPTVDSAEPAGMRTVVQTAVPSAEEPLEVPASPWALAKAFNALALQGFGGVLAVAQRELVERRRWLSQEHFVEMLAISQVLPGPNIVNLALMFGDRFFGFRGGFAALAGMLAVPLVIVFALTIAYAEFARLPFVSGALRGMGAVAAGLVISTAVKLLGTLRSNRLGIPLSALFIALTVFAVAVLRWPLVWVLLGLGAVAVAVAWLRWGER